MARHPAISGFPTRTKLIEATFDALLDCNGSATNEEIQDCVVRLLSLSDEIVDILHADGRQTKLQYELRWARTYLKGAGVIDNASRGVWVILSDYSKVDHIDGTEIVKAFREGSTEDNDNATENDVSTDEVSEDKDQEPWKTQLANILENMDPYAFERLASLLLRECGFTKVEVTKKSGDNGIDGYGQIQLNGLITINVAFQCKRHKELIPSSFIRDFRGSLSGDVEKGIFITTGAFSSAAIEEARDPKKKQHIDLIDGNELIDLLIQHNLGVSEEIVYKVNKKFFDTI